MNNKLKILIKSFTITVLFITLIIFIYYQFFISDITSSNNMNDNIIKETNLNTDNTIRYPAVAGTFYPNDPAELSNVLDELLLEAKNNTHLNHSKNPKIIITPHAGYEYSGLVASHAFATIKKTEQIKRIILIGRSHQSYFNHIAVDFNNIWQTPLGNLQLDQQYILNIKRINEDILYDNNAHESEHSLEVLLPFIIKSFGLDVKIVPFLFGNESDLMAKNLAETIYTLNDEQTLIIISTDLSHYPTPQYASILDELTLSVILENNPNTFNQELLNIQNQYSGLAETLACGKIAIETALHLSQIMNLSPSIVKYSNSFIVKPELSSNAVGYGAVAFYQNYTPPAVVNDDEYLSVEQQYTAINIARDAIMHKLNDKSYALPEEANALLKESRAVFVTLYKNNELRGCMGLFETDKSLAENIAEMAISAAFNDPRFNPLNISEWPEISIEISVLSPIKQISSPDQIILGEHGIIIENNFKRGVYLPQVATETGWDKDTLLNSLCVDKAGLPPNCWLDKNTQLYTFTTQILN